MKWSLALLALFSFSYSGCSRSRKDGQLQLILPVAGHSLRKLSHLDFTMKQGGKLIWQQRVPSSALETFRIPGESFHFEKEERLRLTVTVWELDCLGKVAIEASFLGEIDLQEDDLESENIEIPLRALISEEEGGCR